MSASAAPDLLATIVAATERIVAVRSREVPQETLGWQQRRPAGEAFERALRESPPPRIIAECKRRSPSKGILRSDYDPAAVARGYQAAGAAAISVLTEPTFFDGSPDHLRAVRHAVRIPVLRKDFIIDEYQLVEAVALGADAVLLIVGALGESRLESLLARAHALQLAVVVEVHDLEEMRRGLDAGARIIGVNSRNLRTLSVDLSVLETVAARIGRGVISVAESGIRSREDMDRLVAAGYDAFLVGERLMTQPDPGQALAELRRSDVKPPSGGNVNSQLPTSNSQGERVASAE